MISYPWSIICIMLCINNQIQKPDSKIFKVRALKPFVMIPPVLTHICAFGLVIFRSLGVWHVWSAEFWHQNNDVECKIMLFIEQFSGSSKFQHWLAGWWFQPLWKIWKSVGMILPHIWKNESNVPNHQSASIDYIDVFVNSPMFGSPSHGFFLAILPADVRYPKAGTQNE